MFELNGVTATLEDLQSFAQQNNIDFDTYMDSMTQAGMVEVKAEKPTSGKDVVRNLINIENTVTENSENVINNSLESYFSIADMPVKTELAYSPIEKSTTVKTVQPSEEDIKSFFGEQKYNLYKKYQQTGSLDIEEIPVDLIDSFEKTRKEEVKKESNRLKQEYVSDNKDLIDESFYEAIAIDEDVRGLYSTDFIEKYSEQEELARKRIGEYSLKNVFQLQKEKKGIAEKAVKAQNKYLTEANEVLQEDLKEYENDLSKLNIKSSNDLEKFLENTSIDIDVRREVLEKNNTIVKELNNFKKQAVNFDNKIAALEALDKSYDWGYRAGLAMEKAVFGDIGQLALGIAAKTSDLISEDAAISKYLKNNYVSHINYNESLSEKSEANLPAKLEIKNLEWDNAGTFIGQQLGDNIFSIGTALSYGGIAKAFSKKAAKNIIGGTFFGVEGGSKLSEMEIAQKNAGENLTLLRKTLQDVELTPDQKLEIEKEIEFNEKALNYTQAQRAFSAITYGGIAMYAERLGTMRWIDDLQNVRKLSGDLSMKSILRGSGNFIIKAPGTEVLEETATQIGHNLMDNVILKENKSLIEGVDPDFFASVFITSLAIGGPNVAPNVRNAFRQHVQTKEETQKFRDLADEYIENQFILQQGTNLSKGGINKKQADFIKSRQAEILEEVGYRDINAFNKIADLNAEQINAIFEIGRKQSALFQKNFDLGTFGEDMRSIKNEKDRLNKEYNELQSEKENILNDPAKKRDEKLRQTAKEQNIEESSAMKQAFNYGKGAYYDNLAKGLGKKVIKFDGENALADLEKYLNDNNVDANTKAQITKGFKEGSNGTFNGNDILTFENNRRINMLVGNDVERADAIQVAVHELQHQYDIEKGVVKDGKIVASHKPLVTALKDHVAELYKRGDINKNVYNQFKGRVDQYSEKVNKNKVVDQTELLTLLGTMKRAGLLKEEKTSILYEVKSLINSVRAKFLNENATLLDMKTTNDVLRYIDTFNKRIKQDKTLAQLPPEEKAVVKMSKEASDNVQRIYEEKGIEGVFDIINEFKPIVNRIVDKRKDAPGFDRQLLTDEIETGERGILDLIGEYKPESGVPLAAFINKFLPARAIEASRRVLGEEFTVDVTEAKTVAAEEVAEVEVKPKPKKKKIVLAERLGVTEKVSKAIDKIVPGLDIDKLTFKTLKNKIPNITGELFGIAPKKIESLANLTKKELQSAQMFINKNADLLIAMLPEGATASGTATGVPNTLLKAFYTKTERAKAAKTGSKAGLAIQQKKAINKKEFLETFGIIDGKPDRTDRNTSARVLALANLTGKMITNQAIRQKIGEASVDTKKVVDKLKDGKSQVMFSKGTELLSNYVIGDLSKELGIELTPLIYMQKAGKDKLYTSQRDIDAPFKINGKETGETYKEAIVRGINEYLKSNPEYRDLIQKTMTGGVMSAGFFQTVEEFNNVINGSIVEQKTYTKDPYNTDKRLSKKFVEKTKQKGYKKEQDGKLPLLLDFFKSVEGHLKNNPLDIWIFEEMLKDTGKHQNTLTRILAPITAYPVDKNNNPIYNEEVVEEHTNPQNQIGKALLGAAQIGQLDKMWKAIGKSYMQLSLLKSDDIKINDSGYQTSMPDVYYDKIVPRLLDESLKLPDGFVSVVRLAASGIDLNNYYLINEGKTIAEFFGVNKIKDVKKANEIVIKQLTGEVASRYGENAAKINYTKDIKSLSKFSKAAQNSRVVNDPKGITVLDFDDTLATTKSLVKYTTPEQTLVYNASPKSIKELGKRSGVIYLATDRKEADAYAKSNRGEVRGFVIDDANIVNENIVLKEMQDQGVDISEGLLYEMIDSRFPDFYIGKKNVDKVFNALRKKGIKAFRYEDGSQISSKTTKSIAVIDKSAISEPGTLNAEQYASTYQDLLDQGYTFDFSDFNKVVKGKLAPLFQKALKLQNKFGPENMFVLTARPPQAQKAIYDFLKANGLNIPLKNITGLANSTSEAKALWIAEKVGEGYNDFYFADDALQNVQAVKNMLDQFDVKSKVQQAKVKFSKGISDEFNDILEDVTGIASEKRFSAMKARKRGASKGKFRFFIPPSHEDFVGLLYNFMGKGKQGNAHRDFFEQALIRPLNRAYRELNTARQSIANDYKNLNKQFPDVKKKLTKKTPDGDFTYQDAIRVYLWDKHGYEVPGLSETDQKDLVDLVKSDGELQAYADAINVISKRDDYVSPIETWEAGDLRTDLDDATGRIGREQFFTEFFENADIIFSPENMNKIEAAYGAEMVDALKDMLYRTKTGRNRPSGQNKQVNQFMNWLNGSVAATMFFNIRSAVLQQMSLVNFINFADNNILAAAKAFANQKQYWADWAMLFNSDFMKQRRGGIMTDVNGAELAASVRDAKNPAQAVIKKLLEIGFLPTQIGDNIAIATGGAPFYRNRVNSYLKEGLSQKEAEQKAFVDFQVLAEATQQSARPDMVSQQQASPLGKVILAFQNVTSQFNRLGKKAFLDIKNRRITPGNKTQAQSDISNVSRIAYYFAIQNLIFYSLQSALFMAMFDDDEDDEKYLKKKERMINGSIDSVLRGSGVWGAVVSTLKNMAIKRLDKKDQKRSSNIYDVLAEGLQVSPPLGIKARKLIQAEKDLVWKKKTIEEMDTFDIENPMWSAYTSYIEGLANIPLNRLYNKTLNVRESLNNQNSAMERVLMFSGWSKWNLGIEDVSKSKGKQKFGIKKREIKQRAIKKR